MSSVQKNAAGLRRMKGYLDIGYCVCWLGFPKSRQYCTVGIASKS